MASATRRRAGSKKTLRTDMHVVGAEPRAGLLHDRIVVDEEIGGNSCAISHRTVMSISMWRSLSPRAFQMIRYAWPGKVGRWISMRDTDDGWQHSFHSSENQKHPRTEVVSIWFQSQESRVRQIVFREMLARAAMHVSGSSRGGGGVIMTCSV